ncbi:MAG: aldo/keto reductase [Janthinobacterium lividum]
MLQKTLGRTGLTVSILGVGGHTYPVGDGADDFCTPDQRADLIQRLVSGGVNYFDTTWMNEVELLADSFRRAAVKIQVQVSMQYVDGISDPRWRQNLRSELEKRLEVMGYDRAPLFIMGVGNERPPVAEIAAACEAMQALKAEGLIQNIGLSCHEISAFDRIADVIEATDLVDYMMIRYNWKYPQAGTRLLPLAKQRNIGLVAMKVFCWDCGPDNWGRRISVFEPVQAGQPPMLPAPGQPMNAAQRSLLWCLHSAPFATTVPSINAPWEAEQLLQAVAGPFPTDLTADFDLFRDRLYDPEELGLLAAGAESAAIRDRASRLQSQL